MTRTTTLLLIALVLGAFYAGRVTAHGPLDSSSNGARLGSTTSPEGSSLPEPQARVTELRDVAPAVHSQPPSAPLPEPQPTGYEPPAVEGGTATWCAPTPKYCAGWGGTAHLGAMQSFTYGDRPFRVTVSYQGRSTVVTVVSYCACPRTLIDLSVSAFEDLAPLSRGRIAVTLDFGAGAGPTPPATDR